jgi:hypothetical protein
MVYVMTSVDKRIEKNTNSAINKKKYLEDIVSDPTCFLKDIIRIETVLKSQGAFSEYEATYKNYELGGMSLNTLKRISNNVFIGGFDALERLRLLALETLRHKQNATQVKKRSKKTVTGLEIRVIELESDVESLRKTNLHLLQILSRLRYEIESIADTTRRDLRLKKADDSLSNLSILVSRADESNVIHIKKSD